MLHAHIGRQYSHVGRCWKRGPPGQGPSTRKSVLGAAASVSSSDSELHKSIITASSGIGGRGRAGCVSKAGVRTTDMASDDGGKRGCNLASVVYPLAVVWAACVVAEVCFL